MEIVDKTPIRVGYPYKLQITLLSDVVIHGNCRQHSYPCWLSMDIADSTPIRVGYPWKL